MKVHFSNVGYGNRSWTAECKSGLSYEWLYNQIKPYVMSHDIEFRYDEQTGLGLIFGGFRTIGGFEVKK